MVYPEDSGNQEADERLFWIGDNFGCHEPIIITARCGGTDTYLSVAEALSKLDKFDAFSAARIKSGLWINGLKHPFNQRCANRLDHCEYDEDFSRLV